jgi:ribonucleotide monophosphatase NagD (HAD superfamily)
VALHRNTHFETSTGPALDMGAFLIGLEAASHTTATVVGKPAEAIFRAALVDIAGDVDDVVMVGDDLESDVLGAQALGMVGVLVRTGKYRSADLEGASARPDHVIDGIGHLPALLDSLTDADRI